MFQIRLNAYGATEAGPISVSLSGGENMGMLACRVKVKVNAKKIIGHRNESQITDEIFEVIIFSQFVLDRRCKYRKYLQARRAG